MNLISLKERLRDRKTVFYILTFLILVFIWSNSLEYPSESYSKSNKVLEIVSGFLSRIFGSEHTITLFFKSHVRKIAHFVEYMFLGTAVTSAMNLSRRTKFQHFYNSLSFAVIAAVIDEFIQIYTYRGSSVRDVVIDFTGYFTGTVAVSAFIAVFRIIKREKQG